MSEKYNSNNKTRSGRVGRDNFSIQDHFNQQRKIMESEKLQYLLKFYPYNAMLEEKDKNVLIYAKVHKYICLKLRDKLDKYSNDVIETFKNLEKY